MVKVNGCGDIKALYVFSGKSPLGWSIPNTRLHLIGINTVILLIAPMHLMDRFTTGLRVTWEIKYFWSYFLCSYCRRGIPPSLKNTGCPTTRGISDLMLLSAIWDFSLRLGAQPGWVIWTFNSAWNWNQLGYLGTPLSISVFLVCPMTWLVWWLTEDGLVNVSL